jgi:hypothetical protein
MNKIFVVLLGVLLVIVVSIFSYNSYSQAQQQKRLADIAAQVDNQPVYSTVGMKFPADDRIITLKGVLEFPNIKRCTQVMQSKTSMFDEPCAGSDCASLEVISTCVSYVDAKYKDMLNKKPMQTTYAHVINAKFPDEKAAMAMLGLSSEEAKLLCQELISDKTTDEIDECI